MTKPLVDLGALFSEADHTFDEIMLFRHGFRNDTEIFAFTAYKCSIWNGRKISLEAEKSGRPAQ